jgi:hypothetical protein
MACLDETPNLQYKTTIDSIEGRGIKINKTFSIKELIATYVEKK